MAYPRILYKQNIKNFDFLTQRNQKKTIFATEQ